MKTENEVKLMEKDNTIIDAKHLRYQTFNCRASYINYYQLLIVKLIEFFLNDHDMKLINLFFVIDLNKKNKKDEK